MHLDGGLKLSIAQRSSAGLKPFNEDSLGARVPEGSLLTTKGAVAAIADGVSAAEAGKEAAESCITGFLNDYFSTPESWSVKRSAQQVLNALNRWLFAQGQGYAQAEKGYVSTLSVAVFKSQLAHLFHVGDSRIYRLRDGALEQLTRDHARRISPEHAYLTRAMGLDVNLDVDYRSVDICCGDLFLLSTDGIHDVLPDEQIRQRLAEASGALEPACEQLIDDALAAGSKDNLSCQLLRVEALPLADADDVYQQLSALPFPPPLPPGAVVDGLRIEEELHASPRSQLYRVVDTRNQRQLVMKTPSLLYLDDPAYIERFVLESWIAKRLEHPAVVSVVEPPQRPSCLYYLAEYIPGQSLAQWMAARDRSAVSEAVAVLSQLAKGLQAMHRRDTLHQDIKPDNVMMDGDGRVRIIDFGSCHVAGLAEIAVPLERDHILGTAQYSAPEHVLRKPPSARADQFSLAVVAFEMLSGTLPYEGKLEQCRSAGDYSRLQYVSASDYNPHIPYWMDRALKRALSINPDLRYHDIAEFMHDLHHPNPSYQAREFQPLVHRNPLRFWQGVSAVLLVALLWSLSR